MFDFLTKQGRLRIAERKRCQLQKEREQAIERERREYEQYLEKFPRFEQAYYWFNPAKITKYHLYSSKEIIDLDVYYLGQMIEALNDDAERIDISMLTEKSPHQVFAAKVSSFMTGMLDVLCGYIKPGLVYNELQLQQAKENYGAVKSEYIEYILRWSANHNVVSARMFLYEYLKWQGKCAEANQIRAEAEKLRQTPWFWTSFNHHPPVITDLDDSMRFASVRTGDDFEKFIKWKLETLNIVCDRTGGSGDQGVDIIVYGMPKVAIQCKFYSHDIDNSAVQQVYAGMHYYDCGKAIVVSNAGFTSGAKQLANKLGVKLCGYKDILLELKEYGCTDDDLDEMTPMGTTRGIRETLLRHPGVIV